MDYKFQRTRKDKISRNKIIEQLEKAAKAFNYVLFRQEDFDKIADIGSHTVAREFKTWNNAIAFLSEHLKKKNIELKPGRKGYFSDKELFDEMERVWNLIGHRPSPNEWKAAKPKISSNTYMRYFNGWQNACLKFIEYKMGTAILVDNEMDLNVEKSQRFESKNRNKDKAVSSRTVPLSIRLKVLDRNAYRCVLCGRSPATEIGVRLHIDHKMPFSKGGSSTIDNLQTLCQDCNLGKSDKQAL